MSHWNHRVFKYEVNYSVVYGVRETYYDKYNKVYLWDSNDIVSGDSIEELREYLQWMIESLDKEVIDEKELEDKIKEKENANK